MKRNLLSLEADDNTINCVNGYFLEDSDICICYPGWTSDGYSINQCDIEISGKSNKNETQDIDYKSSEPNEIVDVTADDFVFKAGIAIFALACIFFVLRCLFKKCRKFAYIKKGKKEKGKEKKRKEYDEDEDYDDNEDNKSSFDYKKQCEKGKEEKGEKNSSITKREEKKEDANKDSVELDVNNPK